MRYTDGKYTVTEKTPMKFSEALQMYMDQLDCTAKELCRLSGISAASFSRYKNGERAPERDAAACGS